MSKNVKFSLIALATVVVAGVVVFLTSKDPGIPTAPAPRGEFASDKASEEIGPLPTHKP